MTQPVPTFQLPEPVPPTTTRVLSQAPLPNEHGTFELITWALGAPNPMMPRYKIVRMFPVNGGVDVYGLSVDGRGGIRHHIHSDLIRIIEETMPAHVLAEQIFEEERDDDDEEEEEEEEENGGVEAENAAPETPRGMLPPTAGQA